MLTLVAWDFHLGESGDFENVKLDLTKLRQIVKKNVASSTSHP